MFKILNFCKKINYTTRNISVCKFAFNEEKSKKRKVKETVELVTLVDQNDKILGLKSKSESEMLARKLNLTLETYVSTETKELMVPLKNLSNLERVNDTKYGKIYPAYKMFSTSDLLRAENKASNAKVLKKLPLNCRISEHDLALKVQIIRRWLSKNCEVHVAISNNNEGPTLMKSVFTKIQDLLKDECRLLDIRNKDTAIKFIVLPPKQTAKKDVPESEKKVSKADKSDK